jgi:hypothetical protein
MAIVCVTVFATIVYRVRMDFVLKTSSVKSYSSLIITVTSAIINLICSIILSQFYYWIAKKLTNYGRQTARRLSHCIRTTCRWLIVSP